MLGSGSADTGTGTDTGTVWASASCALFFERLSTDPLGAKAITEAVAWKIAEPLPAVLVEVRLLLLKAPVRAPVPVLGSVPVVLGRVPLTPLLCKRDSLTARRTPGETLDGIPCSRRIRDSASVTASRARTIREDEAFVGRRENSNSKKGLSCSCALCHST